MRTVDEVLDGFDLAGRVAVVTGASSGLGLETARAFAGAGAHVVLGIRDRAKADTTAEALRRRVPRASVEILDLDLADLASVRRAAGAVLCRHERVDLLVNNAGVMFTPLARTADGFEMQFGTNHLGHFLLTELLTPALVAAAPARVVTVSSSGHALSDIDWDDPNYERRRYDKFEAYGQSKTANILFTVELERRLGPVGVHAYAVHPGMVATDLARHMNPGDMKELFARRRPSAGGGSAGGRPELRGVETGAATTVWAALAPELDGRGGLYLVDCAVAEPAPYASRADAATRLWELSQKLVYG